MKLPISDLMETCITDSIVIHTETNTANIKANVLHRIRTEQPRRKHFKPSVLLIAAAVMTLLIGTAVATTSAISGRKVTDTAETVWFSYVPEADDYQRVHWADASYAINLDITEDSKSQENIVYYRLGWLPTEFEGEIITPEVSADKWIPNDSQVCKDLAYKNETYDHTRNFIPYQIKMYTIQTHEFDYVYYLNGDTTLVKQDLWNGWNRLELTVDYINSNSWNWAQPINYLLLYNAKENILICICGMMDLETYEKIAENMEIQISDERYEYPVPEKNQQIGSPAQILDLGRG